MTGAIQTLTTFEEFTLWHPENSDHRYELRDEAIGQKIKPNGKHSKIAELLSLIEGSKQPPVHLHLFVSEGKLLITTINSNIRSLWKERQDYLAEMAKTVLSLVSFTPYSNPKIFFLQGVDWIILNRKLGEPYNPLAVCSGKFVLYVIQEVRPMR